MISIIYSFILSNNKSSIIDTLNFNFNINALEYGYPNHMGIIVLSIF
jgi:aspartyl-tRNA synthetase